MFTVEKYSSEPFGSAFIVLPPSFQLAGHTSPCFSCTSISIHVCTQREEGETHDELERLDEADRLVDGAADGEVVDRDLAEDAGGVDDEQPAERDAVLLNAAVGLVAVDADASRPLADRIRDKMAVAAESIDSGAAQAVLDRWVAFSRS